MTDAKFWDSIAEKYAKSPIADTDAYEYTLERVRSHLKDSDRIMEIGAGTGTTALRIATSVEHYLATDVSRAMTEIGRDKATAAGTKNIGFMVAGADALPEGPYDAVLAFNLLHLLSDLDGALAEIAARVNPGGLFISKSVCLSGPGIPLWMRGLLLGLPVMQLVGKAPYVRRFSIAGLEEAITRAGFRIVETGNYPDRPARRFIVARKPE